MKTVSGHSRGRNEMKKIPRCTVPGCNAVLDDRNRSTVCKAHLHDKTCCRCWRCNDDRKGRRKPSKPKPSLQPSAPELVRYSAHGRPPAGGWISVTADTAEEAQTEVIALGGTVYNLIEHRQTKDRLGHNGWQSREIEPSAPGKDKP